MPKDLWKPRKRQSSAQKQQSLAALAKASGGNKENEPPVTKGSTLSLTRSLKTFRTKLSNTEGQLKDQQYKIKEARRVGNNALRRKKRREGVVEGLKKELKDVGEDKKRAVQMANEAEQGRQAEHEEKTGLKKVMAGLKKKNDALRMKISRALKKKHKPVDPHTTGGSSTPQASLKEKGVITESARELIRDLVAFGLPVEHVNDTIQAVSDYSGSNIQGSLSARSVGRIVLEGGIAAQMQVVDEVNHAESITISGDGTGLRNVNYESKHANFRTTLYDAPRNPSDELPHSEPTAGGERVTRFLGLMSSKDHTAETQMEGWKTTNAVCHEIYNDSPRGKDIPVNPRSLPAKTVAMNSDHAPDQKKLGRFWKGWSIESDRILRGERVLQGEGVEWTAEALLELIVEESERKLEEAGGLDAFERLSAEDQQTRNEVMQMHIYQQVGEASYATMSPEQQRAADLFIWAGCCMHKELNAVKSGDTAMKGFWEKQCLTGPVRLMNKDNVAAAAAGPSDAQKRAEAVSQGGGTKLTSLAGAIFNHKDEKKGQGDSFRIFFEREVGYMIRFPDTSNTRYQSHCEAAAELLVHLHLYIKFLLQIRDKKENQRLNNMEKNVYLGLHDIPTLTELAVLTLYGQAISHPYLREVRGPGREFTNLLDLGPLHERVKTHCRAVIANPGLLLAAECSSSTGSMDGKGWDRPEAVYAVHALAYRLPHLEGALVAFFEGALEAWIRFTTEYEPGGVIASTSKEERERAYMKSTNDDNEGTLGMLRVGSRRAPSMTLHQRNARIMYKRNHTKLYIKMILNPTKANHKYLWKRARLLDSSRIEKRQRQLQAKADQEVVEKKRLKDTERTEKAAQVNRELDKVVCRLDVAAIQALPGTNTLLDSELGWFRRVDSEVPIKARLTNKALKLSALLDAVKRFNAGTIVGHSHETVPDEGNPSDIDSDADMKLGY